MKNEAVKKNKKVSFCLQTKPGNEVFVAGSFNDWNPKQFRLRDGPEDGVFRIALTLPPGRHEYKFIVNGEWHLDPSCSALLSNNQGSLNSVVAV